MALRMYHDGVLTAPALKGWDLCRSFGAGEMRTEVLRDISIELAPGQMALLMGPSGSGKSTLLAVLSGLLQPDSGRVLAHDHDLWSLSERQREDFRLKHCGFVFQGYNLFPALTARQQLEMVLRWGKNTPAKEARDRADNMLAMLDLAKKEELRPLQLSGGEKQRVAVGRALIKDPTFVFADEPTAALDWKHGEHVIELLRNAAHDSGASVLVVAHDARIIPYADRVFYLDDGVIVEGVERAQSLFAGSGEVATYQAQAL
jgi:putative ABC transport system ATP-binding protein